MRRASSARTLQAYAAAGIRSDHEAMTVEEGRQRLRAGIWLLIREASMARNLRALLPLVQEYGPARMAFCTDDRDPEDIVDSGHVNQMVREAVGFGIPPEDALVLASHNPAVWHGLDHLGAVAPGYQADLLVLPDLESFQPDVVLKAGRPVGEIPKVEVPEWVRHTVRIQPIAAGDFRIPWTDGQARVIGLIPDQVVTELLLEEPTVADGEAVADPERDLAKIAVIERHLGTGRIGIGFVRGTGLKSGALGSTVAHDAHNIVVVGVDDHDMARAVQRLAELGGGIVAVEASGIRARAAAARRRAPRRRPARGGGRAQPRLQRGRRPPRLHDRHAFPDAVLPGLVRDPEPEADRPGPRRRGRVPHRSP